MKFAAFSFLLFCLNFGYAQDTVFHKTTEKYEALVSQSGYNHVYILKHDRKVDTVWTWEYGAYMKIQIFDIVYFRNYHISLNSTGYDIGYSVYEQQTGKWEPLMGGILAFLTDTRKKVDASIIDGDKFRLVEEDGQETILKINFTNKTLERYDK